MEKVQRLLSDTAVNINSQTKMVRLFTQCCIYVSGEDEHNITAVFCISECIEEIRGK